MISIKTMESSLFKCVMSCCIEEEVLRVTGLGGLPCPVPQGVISGSQRAQDRSINVSGELVLWLPSELLGQRLQQSGERPVRTVPLGLLKLAEI